MGKEFQELNAPQPLTGDPIQGLVTFDIPNDILDHSKNQEALKALCNSWAPGTSSMTIKDLKHC